MKRLTFLLCFLLLAPCFVFVYSQNKIQADVTIQQLVNKQVLTIRKSIYYRSDGRMVTHLLYPKEMFVICNSLGESSTYIPEDNIAWTSVDAHRSTKDEILHIFSSDQRYDLGLSSLGFHILKQEQDSTRIVKTFVPDKPDRNLQISHIDMVYEGTLPIYCAYFNNDSAAVKKIYYQDYIRLPRFYFPRNITEITLNSNNDTIIRRQKFENILWDERADSPYFSFQVPDSAVISQDMK